VGCVTGGPGDGVGVGCAIGGAGVGDGVGDGAGIGVVSQSQIAGCELHGHHWYPSLHFSQFASVAPAFMPGIAWHIDGVGTGVGGAGVGANVGVGGVGSGVGAGGPHQVYFICSHQILLLSL